MEQDKEAVYYIPPGGGKIVRVADDRADVLAASPVDAAARGAPLAALRTGVPAAKTSDPVNPQPPEPIFKLAE